MRVEEPSTRAPATSTVSKLRVIKHSTHEKLSTTEFNGKNSFSLSKGR